MDALLDGRLEEIEIVWNVQCETETSFDEGQMQWNYEYMALHVIISLFPIMMLYAKKTRKTLDDANMICEISVDFPCISVYPANVIHSMVECYRLFPIELRYDGTRRPPRDRITIVI